MRTAQEIFDVVATHLHTQRKRCIKVEPSGATMCVYRNQAGEMCAAGCLIPDDEYSTTYEGETWGESATIEIAKKIGNYDLVCELQEIHDNMEDETDDGDMVGVTEPMREVAKKNGLSPAILDTFEPL